MAGHHASWAPEPGRGAPGPKGRWSVRRKGMPFGPERSPGPLERRGGGGGGPGGGGTGRGVAGGATAGWLGSWGQPEGLARGSGDPGPRAGAGAQGLGSPGPRRGARARDRGPLLPPAPHPTARRPPRPSPRPWPWSSPRSPFPCLWPLSPLQHCPALPAAPQGRLRRGWASWRGGGKAGLWPPARAAGRPLGARGPRCWGWGGQGSGGQGREGTGVRG